MRQAYSARLARDLVHEDAFEDAWLVRLNTPKKPKSATIGPGSGVLLVLVAMFLILFVPGKNGPESRPLPSYLPPVSSLTDKLSQLMPGYGKLSLRDDFKVDLRDWQSGLDGIRDGWARMKDSVQIGELRLWKPTLSMTDYQMHFQGEIESKALGWAFRATDYGNYYATKINVRKRGSSFGGSDTRAEIVRYVVRNGKKLDSVEFPIPLIVDANTVYDVRLRVKGDHFSTVVNGRLVDTWTDDRFPKGGVGFFSDAHEIASVNWVTVSEGESFLDRFLSFSLLVAPPDLPARRW